MPRPPRIVRAGDVLHIIQRGNNRTACFADDDDRERYLKVLLRTSERSRCAIHAYVLMSNHTHLLVTAAEPRAPSRMMQSLGRTYVRYFNERHGRTGTLWEGRYRSSVIDSERYFFQCSRYIESNPVRAGMVSEPAAYRWSSFRCNADGEPDALVRLHPIYLALGRWGLERRAAYRAMFDTPLPPRVLDAIRCAADRGEPLGLHARGVIPLRRLRRVNSRRCQSSGQHRRATI